MFSLTVLFLLLDLFIPICHLNYLRSIQPLLPLGLASIILSITSLKPDNMRTISNYYF